MENKGKNILKKGMMETKSDFTSSLMDQINLEEKALSNVLSEHGSMHTSNDFAASIMSQLEGKIPSKIYTPVISKQVWIGIAAVLVGIVVLTISLVNIGPSHTNFDFNPEAITTAFSSFFKNSPTVVYVGLGVLFLSVSLLLEQRIGSKT